MGLEAATVRVRFLALTGALDAQLRLWRSMLDDEERCRADRFHFQRDREAFTAAHALKRAMLSEATGAPITSWRFRQGPYGKPEIAAGPGLQQLCFNISHTDGLIACAVTYGCDLGIDVEASNRTIDLAITDRYFAPSEAAIIRAAPPDQALCLFFRFWTLKEAFIKATGEGLSRPLASFAFTLDPISVAFYPNGDGAMRDDNPARWQFAQCRPVPDRFLALALRRADTANVPIDIRAVQREEISPR
ncbi:MAG TPA: 4'-phosphopantetheinyl transferase superfamily protein [Acetobacteraceae bacterium]|nr:4'-phosphopantetheinyl transferase superfamily protein [Acetobacteraceae bacterium]